MNGITKETFVESSTETKLNILFDYIVVIHQTDVEQDKESKRQRAKCDRRIQKLENRKKIDTGIAAGGGVLGGIGAVVTYLKLFVKSIGGP
jgi:hypothetical protein